MNEIEIGYVCSRGHFCFHADPDEGGECGSKSVGIITVTLDRDLTQQERKKLMFDASASLANVYDAWRNCECSEVQP